MILRCILCDSVYKSIKDYYLKGKKGEKIWICLNCRDEIVRNNLRFTADVMIVPVRRESLEKAIKDRIYICPSNYIRKIPKLIAFYLGGEIGAITHIAKVKNIIFNVSREEIFKKGISQYKLPWQKHLFYNIFKLEKLIELENSIKRGKFPPIQNRTYVSFVKLAKAKSIGDLKN